MTDDAREQVSLILDKIRSGAESPAALMPLIHRELYAMAAQMMRGERGDHTLQATALVNELFVRLFEGQASLGRKRHEFLAIAATAMRRLLVDHARRARASKRGGGVVQQVTLSGVASGAAEESLAPDDVLDLHHALKELEALDERQARVVEFSYFGGMSGQEIADALGVHRNSVVRDLQMARAWLRRALSASGGAHADRPEDF